MLKEIIDNMSEKLGEDVDLITDNIARLYQYESDTNEEISKRDNEINKLKDRNNTLTEVNANLLKSVPMANTKDEAEPFPKNNFKEEKVVTFKECFDEKGNFVK